MLHSPNNAQFNLGSCQIHHFEEKFRFNPSKILNPLDNFTSAGAQPTLFQKNPCLSKNLANRSVKNEGGNGYDSGDFGEIKEIDGREEEKEGAQ